MYIVIWIVIVVLMVGLLVKNLPVFGGKHSETKKVRYTKSRQYQNGKFVNELPTSWDTDLRSMIGMVRDFLKRNQNRTPESPIPVKELSLNPEPLEDGMKVIWFGHSAFLVEWKGKRFLFDPMFGKAPSPFPLRTQRYSRKLPFEIASLPEIDAVFLSHDHYDHLDYGSIMKLKGKVRHYFVPLGVGSHLERWGISSEHISEHDWWDEVSFEGFRFACTPARHFSGRGLTDRDRSLWCSWVILGKDSNLFYSGDSGYGPHFKEIGEKFGPFDVTLMECGQYDKRWSAIHMLPEETVQAHMDVLGNVLIPVHWGAFTLSLHAWTDPIERAQKAAKESGVKVATPMIGEPFIFDSTHIPEHSWWLERG